MEQIKIKKRARTIPFGFKQSEDPEYLEPVKEELDALRQAKEYSKTCSCLLYTSPSPRDVEESRMPSSA